MWTHAGSRQMSKYRRASDLDTENSKPDVGIVIVEAASRHNLVN